MATGKSPYEEDLAYIHDVGYDFHARGLAEGLLKLLREAGVERGASVVDLGCGSGIWAERLAREGYRPVGVDISPAMIELARRRLPAGELHVSSFLDFELPRCGAITSFGEVLCFQFDRGNNRRALARLFKRCYEVLSPGGLLAFDIVERGLDRGRLPTWKAGDDWACLVSFEHDERRQQVVRHITTFRKFGELYRRGEEAHRVQLYDRREVAAMLRRVGFRVRTFRRLGEYELLAKRVGFIANKR